MSEVEIVTVSRDGFADHMATMERFFGQAPTPGHAHLKDVLGSATLARIDGEDVGTGGVINFSLIVPGGNSIPMAGVTIVVVSPVARRRGVLRGLMQRFLDDARGQGTPLLGLGATESSIYRRFGYGAASFGGTASIDLAHAAWRAPVRVTGRLRPIPVDEALPVWLDIESRLDRPGSICRHEGSWQRILTTDRATRASGGAVMQCVVHEDSAGVVDGFVNYSQEERWQEDVADWRARVHQFAALTREAHLALWDHVLTLDLCSRLEFEFFDLDDPVQHLLLDPRRLRITPHDDLHLRIADVSAVLAARRYSREDSLVIEVRDPTCPDIEGRYRVAGGLDGAESERTDASPDLVLDAPSLGSIYLGGVSPVTLQAAGLVEELRPGSVRRASAMFAWQPRPHLPFMF